MRLTVLLLAGLLSGCAMVEGYFMATFDGNIYGSVAHIRTTAEIANDSDVCKDPAKMAPVANSLRDSSLELYNYSQYIKHNDDVINMSSHLVEMTKTLQAFYEKTKPSEAYCHSKLNGIINATSEMQRVIGKEPRY